MVITTVRLLSLALRSLGTRKSRTALTTAGIVLGVAVILATTIANQSTVYSFQEMINSITGKADFWINGASSAGFSEKKLKDVRDLEGIKLASPGVSRGSTLRKGRRRDTVQVAGIDPVVDRQLRHFNVSKGRFIKKGEFTLLIPARLAEKKKIKIGDQVTLESKERKTSFEVVGLLEEEGAGRFMGGKVVFIPLSSAQKIFDMRGKLSYIDAQAKPGRSLKKVAAQLSERLGKRFVIERPEKRVEAVSEMLRGLQVGLSFFGAIALFVGGFLVYNTFSMVVVEQTQEMGVLRSIGGSRGQITILVLIQAAVVGISGSALGVVVGIGLAKVLLQFMSETVQIQVVSLTIPLLGVAAAIAIGIAVTLLAALQPAFIAGRVSPLAAIKIGANEPTRRGTFARLFFAFLGIGIGGGISYLPGPEELGSFAKWAVPIHEFGSFMLLLGAALLVPSLIRPLGSFFALPIRAIFRENGKLAAVNLQKNRGRTAATVAAIMITMAMLISVGGMVGSFRKSVDKWVDKSLGADVFVSGQNLSVTFNEKLGAKLRRVKGVSDLTTIRIFPVQLDEDRIMFRAVEPKSLRRFATLQFTSKNPEKSWASLKRGRRIFISNVVANKRGLKVGDETIITTVKGPKTFVVAGVTVDFGGDIGDLIIGTRSDMKKYFDLDDVSAFRIKVNQGVAPRKVANRIEKKFKHLNPDVQDIQEFKDLVTGQVNSSFSVFNVLILLAAIIAVISLFNTLTMNILERRREIGLLRAVGATRGQIGLMTMLEALMTGAIGVFLGLLVGGFIASDIVNGMNLLTGYEIVFAFPTEVTIMAVVFGLAAAMLAAIYPAHRAATLEIGKAIQYE